MAEPVRMAAGGVDWSVAAAWRDLLLGAAGLRLDEWLASGQARVVKHGPHRTVYRVTLPGLDVHVKRNRLMNTRAWLRELLRPAKARIEFDLALAVAARGVPTVEPLAVGRVVSKHGPGESYLVTRSIEGTEQLDRFLMTTLPGFAGSRQARVRQRVAAALGAFVARMHDAGLLHHDLHPGNLLVRLGAHDQPELFLVDLHAVRLRAPLDWPASRANLVILNRWFTMRAARADRLRFWHSYCDARATPGLPSAVPGVRAALAVDLEDRSLASNLAFWKGRDRRCLASNRYFHPVRSAAAAGHAVRDLGDELLARLLADPDAPFTWPGVKLLKDSRSATVAEFEAAVNGVTRPLIYKRFRVTTWTDPWAALMRRSPALRSWGHGHGLIERCLPSPRPLLVLHRRLAGLDREGYLLTEKVPDAVDLHGLVAGLDRLPAAERRAALRRHIDHVARLVRDLHDRRLTHRDLKAANVLATPAENPTNLWLIDLVGVSRHEAEVPRARRVKDLTRLHASFHQSPALTRADKVRFLRAYLRWGLFGRAGWKRWWHAVAAGTAAKVARNARRGRVLG